MYAYTQYKSIPILIYLFLSLWLQPSPVLVQLLDHCHHFMFMQAKNEKEKKKKEQNRFILTQHHHYRAAAISFLRRRRLLTRKLPFHVVESYYKTCSFKLLFFRWLRRKKKERERKNVNKFSLCDNTHLIIKRISSSKHFSVVQHIKFLFT